MREAGNGSDVPGCIIALAAPWCVIGIFIGCMSCGPSVSTQTRVDYALEVAHCDEEERAIIARQGTTREEDTAAMAAERVRCDEARAALLHAGVDGGVR